MIVAPQRSTQYADWVNALATPELQLSPLGELIERTQPVRLGGLDFVGLTLREAPSSGQLAELGHQSWRERRWVEVPALEAGPRPEARR